MSKFVNLTRLGITRAWNIRPLTTTRVYAQSIIHCLFIYTLLRTKIFRMGLWVVAYFIHCTSKKYLIHVFFWRIPGLTKKRIFKFSWGVQVRYKKKVDVWSTRIVPSRIQYRFLLRTAENNSKKLRKINKFSQHWVRGNNLLKFWYFNYIKNYRFYVQAFKK